MIEVNETVERLLVAKAVEKSVEKALPKDVRRMLRGLTNERANKINEIKLLKEKKFELDLYAFLEEQKADIVKAFVKTAGLRKAQEFTFTDEQMSFVAGTFDSKESADMFIQNAYEQYGLGGQQAFSEMGIGIDFRLLDPNIEGFSATNLTTEAVDNYNRVLSQVVESGQLSRATMIGRAAYLTNAIQQGLDERVKESIKYSLREGHDIRRASKHLAGQVERGARVTVAPKIVNGKVVRQGYTYDIPLRRWSTITARSESIFWAAEGKLAGYQQSGVVNRVIFANAGDERVCPACDALEGSVYKIEEAHGIITVHAQCRCTWIPDTSTIEREIK